MKHLYWKILSFVYPIIRPLFVSNIDSNEDYVCCICMKPILRRTLYCSKKCFENFIVVNTMLANEYISKWMNIHIVHSDNCEARGDFDFAPCTCEFDKLLNERNVDIASLSKEEYDKVISYAKEEIRNSKETTVCNDIESIKWKQ